MKDKAYEAVGPNYRFFLTWRHAAFAGNLIVLWGAYRLFASACKERTPFIFIIPLLASLVALCLWFADKRTRQIYRAIVKAGKILEEDGKGPYTELENISIPRNATWFPKKGVEACKIFSHSFALSIFFLGSSIALFSLSIYLLFCPLKLDSIPIENKIAKPNIKSEYDCRAKSGCEYWRKPLKRSPRRKNMKNQCQPAIKGWR